MGEDESSTAFFEEELEETELEETQLAVEAAPGESPEETDDADRRRVDSTSRQARRSEP